VFMAVCNGFFFVVSNALVLYYCNPTTIRYQKKKKKRGDQQIRHLNAFNVNVFVNFSIHYKTCGLGIK
jgi:hypothetical protein